MEERNANMKLTDEVMSYLVSMGFDFDTDAEDDDYEDRIFFSNKEIIDEFKAYKEEYVEENNQALDTQFFVSPSAYKKNARYLRSVIKLDKNFHVYVHGNHDLIEKQSDEKGKFYKIYYEAES